MPTDFSNNANKMSVFVCGWFTQKAFSSTLDPRAWIAHPKKRVPQKPMLCFLVLMWQCNPQQRSHYYLYLPPPYSALLTIHGIIAQRRDTTISNHLSSQERWRSGHREPPGGGGLVLNPIVAADPRRVRLDRHHGGRTGRAPGVLTSGPVKALPSPSLVVDTGCVELSNTLQYLEEDRRIK